MGKIIAYLLAVSAAYLVALGYINTGLSVQFEPFRIGANCALTGGLAGCLYCLRAVYLNACVRKNWDLTWGVWYFLRPITSAGSGAISFVFMKAGLLVLEAGTKTDATEFGFYALALIAGLNVDNFIRKIEEVAESVWGVKKSRASELCETGKEK
ncbi:MAG: hypothetical protein PHW76_05590 [Alphaproteobacteria bacterium]|nr:hypothetical protein [Alphaproteobacteria bacterium]